MQKLLPCTVSRTAKWKPFLKMARSMGASKEAAQRLWKRDETCENFRNDTYHVMLDKNDPHGFGKDIELWYLSIKRHDREPILDWRDFQEIKNQICGEEHEGMMLYPSEKRVVDTANQDHMYVFMNDGFKIPCGMWGGIKTDTADMGAAKQRSRT
jgi:hypothetical protein